MRKKYMPRALGPLLLVVLSPAVAQQNDDNEIIVSASRSNRTVAEMAQTTGLSKMPNWSSRFRAVKS